MAEAFEKWIELVASYPLATYGLMFGILVVSGAGLPVAEEIIVVTAGVLIHRGALEWAPAWGVCYVGILLADAIVFTIGRRFGKAVLHRKWMKRVLHPRRVIHAHHHVHEHGAWVLMASRFIPASRWPTMLITGMAHLPFWKFMLADGAAAIVSVTIQMVAGYYLAELTTAEMDEGRRWMTIGMIAAGLTLLGAYFLWRRYGHGGGREHKPRLRRFTHLRRRRRGTSEQAD